MTEVVRTQPEPDAQKLKAYSVQGEEQGEIVYAKSNIEARKWGAHEFNDGELGGITCTRAEWADKYAPGPCPNLVKLDHGWWIGCSGCEAEIHGSVIYVDGDEVEVSPVERKGYLYCSAKCANRYARDKKARKAREERALAELRASLLAKIPTAEIVEDDFWGKVGHAYVVKDKGRWRTSQARITFRFPGCKIASAKWGFDKTGEEPGALVCNGDLKAFERWRDAGYPATMPELVDA